MDRMNFYLFQKGDEYEYYGKEEEVTYVRIKPPSLGRWFIVVDTSKIDENISVDWRILDWKFKRERITAEIEATNSSL